MNASGASPEPPIEAPASASKALLVYNAERLGLLAVCIGIGYLAGLRSIALIVIALLVSGVVSWFLLRTPRIKAGMAVERAVNSSAPRRKLRAKVAAEDAYAEAFQEEQAARLAKEREGDHAKG